jgi:hypothetical protein
VRVVVRRARSLFGSWRHRLEDLFVDLRMLLLRRTSIGHARRFPSACAKFAADPVAFTTFKRDPEVRVVIENLTCEHGQRYLEIALEQTPALMRLLERFRENDRVGLPRTCDYGRHGVFSPTTLRYLKVTSDLLSLFGPFGSAAAIEIGGGYGGQCYIASVAIGFSSYTLVDLEPVLDLQRAYVHELGVPNVQLARPRDLDGRPEYDLVISNFAFSECVRRVQRFYLERVLRRSARGYVTCNWLRPRLSHTREELLAAVPGSRFIWEDPASASGAEILVWGTKS